MPPKVTFNKQDVVFAGLEIVKESGLSELSARKIAEKLGSSTAPIYSYFNSIEEFKHEVLNEATKILLNYIMNSYTDTSFLNMGIGTVLFARDNPQLYRAIYLDNAEYVDVTTDFKTSLQREMDKDQRFSVLNAESKRLLLKRMMIFTHGLATLVCVGQIKMETMAEIIEMLYPMGTAVIDFAFKENDNPKQS